MFDPFRARFIRSLNHEFFVDPATLALIGTGVSALLGGASLVSSLGSKPAPPSIPAPAPPSQSPTGSPTSNANPNAPSFLAAAAAPQSGQTATKSLLGQ